MCKDLRMAAYGCLLQAEGLGALLAALPELNKSEAEFRMEKYPDEKAATLPFLQHLEASDIRHKQGHGWLKGVHEGTGHQLDVVWSLLMRIRFLHLCQSVVRIMQEQLRQLCGPQWDRWAVEDIRSMKLSWLVAKKQYTVRGPGGSLTCTNCCRRVGELALRHALALTSNVPSLVLQGFQDLGIYPASASKDSLAQLRMGFELKHTPVHKQLYQRAQEQAAAEKERADRAAAAEAQQQAAQCHGPLARGALQLRQSQRVQAARAAPPTSQAAPLPATSAAASKAVPVPGAQPHAVQACMSHAVNHVASMNVLAGVAWDKRVKGQSILEVLCNYRCACNVLPGPHITIACWILTKALTGALDFAALGRICEWPLAMVVTDGRMYHTLQLRGNDIQVVLNLSALDGLRLIAARLWQVRAYVTL